jgi:hypothetical protein
MNILDKYHHSIPITAIIFIITLPLAAYFLRQNNLGMVERRDDVIRIDQQTGDLSKVEPALNELRSYVLTHMNADLGAPVEFPGAYNKAVEEARRQAEGSGSANGEVYRRAQAACEDPSILLSARAQCIQDYVVDNAPPGSDAQALDFPPKELFSYSFLSPAWSFDLAGISVLLSLCVLAWLVYLVVTQLVIGKLADWVAADPLE